jgi:hypothetical protein
VDKIFTNSRINPSIERALHFIDSLRVNETRGDYFEVAERDHSEHRVYNQSQYLLAVLFKKLEKNDLFQAIRRQHPPNEPDNDPRRKRHKANDRFCILEGDIKPFYLARRRSSKYNDEKALIALYWIQRERPRSANRLWEKLYSQFNSTKGVLQMDKADRERNLYPVYKVALFGILAQSMKHISVVRNVQQHLQRWQHRNGGWETDRTRNLRPDGVANIETTVLSILALLP